jgi:hypothetical protein
MLYYIKHGLGNWRQGCYVEVNDQTGMAESGYWAVGSVPLTEEELDFANKKVLKFFCECADSKVVGTKDDDSPPS